MIELCLAMALIAILSSLALPTFRAAARNAAIRSAFLELAAGLQLTRASAISQARRGVLCLSQFPGGNCLSDGGTNAWTAFLEVDGQSQPLAARALPAGVMLHASRTPLSFWPDNRGASPGTLTICDTQGVARPRALVLSQLGRIRFADGDEADCRS